MRPLAISAWTVTSALGTGRGATLAALRDGHGGLVPCDFSRAPLDTWIGRVPAIEHLPLPANFSRWDCRNNRLAGIGLQQDGFMLACEQARERYGPENVGIFVGTSTSGIEQAERAYRERGEGEPLPGWFDYAATQDVFSLADFMRRYLGLSGPALAISTACSSSAKVFATAWRHMQAGLCRAAVVGGVDTLCLMTLYGFHSLQLVSGAPCRPADVQRDGISLGEAAGFALLEWPEANCGDLRLLGYGESSDAYHMSAPHPDGVGAYKAMAAALRRADLTPDAIDWVHLHGTGTPANDLAEDKAIEMLFGKRMTCSSTKGWTGHTLGAAGIVGFALAALALEEGFVPASLNTRNVDPALTAHIVLENHEQSVERVLVNAFGFGGSNASLLVGRA